MFNPTTHRGRRYRFTVAAGLTGVVALLAACGSDIESAAAPAVTQAANTSTANSAAAAPSAGTSTSDSAIATTSLEVTPSGSAVSTGPDESDATDRLTLTYDGGIYVLDAETLETVADLPLRGFNRLNTAGDGQHVYVTTEGGFRVLRSGAGGGEAELTDLTFPAKTPGHVVRHDGITALFDDGTGDINLFPTNALVDGSETVTTLPESRLVKSAEAHHGVAVELTDGTLLGTIGDSESRIGTYALDATGAETARFEECPSVHGEGVAADETVVFGCQDGLLVYADGAFTKLDSPDDFGRIGNAYVTDSSSVTVLDYKDDPDAEGVELSHIALADVGDPAAASLDVLDLPEDTYYTWRGVGRDGDDDAWILGTDGSLHRVDVAAGRLAESFPVVKPWRGPAEWQTAHPALVVDDHIAYVTEPAAKSVHRVDLDTGEILASAVLPAASNEIALVN